MLLISVVIPTYNRAHTIARAIDSVLAQTYGNFELIVVDDASTDETLDILKGYGGRIKVLKQQRNEGVSVSRNRGVREAKGSYICFLDSDDAWRPQKLEFQVNLLEREDFKIIHSEEIWIRKGVRVNPKKIHQKYGGWIFKECLPRCIISPSAVMIEKETFLQEGGFDETLVVCEDYDLWAKLTCRYEVGFIEEPLIIKYGGHRDQLSRRYRGIDYYRIVSLERIRKHRSLSNEQKQLVSREIARKCRILTAARLRHKLLDHLHDLQRRDIENRVK